MELTLELHPANTYPLRGILIKSPSAAAWLKALQDMGLSLAEAVVYPVPSSQPNVLWGCLVTVERAPDPLSIGRHTFCQLVNGLLYIPERASLFPQLSGAEFSTLLKGRKHLLHPEFGLVEMEEPIRWQHLLGLPAEQAPALREPAAAPFIPTQIRTFQVRAVAEEDALNALEQHFPKRENLPDKPLNPLEKAKLFLYRTLFTKDSAGNPSAGRETKKSALLQKLEALGNAVFGKTGRWAEKLMEDFDELERRNQKEFDRLMDMLHNSPEEALRYAIPLDERGTARGAGNSPFKLQWRWFDFSLLGGSGGTGGGGSVVLPDDAFQQLHTRYTQVAQQLIDRKEYEKAAFVYMKLLKNPGMAAQTLEKGGLYQEAASLYLKHTGNKLKAAECFEKGNMTLRAIELYKELDRYEKAGDLYMAVHKTREAQVCYQKVADDYVQNSQYVKASLVFSNKMNNPLIARELLMKGWRSNKDALNCLQLYFAGIPDEKQLTGELQTVYAHDVHARNSETFLQVLHHQYTSHPALSGPIREMAYEIVVEQIPANPAIASELRMFNKNDKQLLKDTMRFRLTQKGKPS